MASIDEDEFGDQRLNVANVVSAKEHKDFNDVIVVQGLLHFIYDGGFTKWTKVAPYPPGTIDHKNVGACILNYQNYVRSHPNQHPFWVAGDGRVSPAPFGKSVCGPKQEYTISSLNNVAGMIWASHSDWATEFKDHVEAIVAFYPLVAFAVMRLDFGAAPQARRARPAR